MSTASRLLSAPLPNMRVRRTRSSALPPRSPLTRRPLGPLNEEFSDGPAS